MGDLGCQGRQGRWGVRLSARIVVNSVYGVHHLTMMQLEAAAEAAVTEVVCVGADFKLSHFGCWCRFPIDAASLRMIERNRAQKG